ncbi:hypothetical protein DFJ43DRAFT_1004861 [Lentinula guzmanii]|uniref:Uncharacterized protein n=1 Tax=Lentinula guzmanii TaxID=2804957 RepID=A0AA38MWV6_9AGAR|nr:hypothetical protein DFJ43DRAFT_1004861 [Lentinula guzmanii]
MSDADFPVDTAQIVALFMESVTYGVFLTTFMMCLHGLLYSPTHRFHLKPYFKVNYRMLIAAYLMFIFASLDVAFGLCHNINAFVTMNGNGSGNGPENAEKVFGDMGNWLNVMKFVDYVVQTFVGDTILIYRCYLVWDRTWYVIIPSVLLCLAETVCGCMVAVIEASPESGGSLNSSTISPFITSMLSITLATTILTTSLIVYRLWNVQSHSQTLLHFQQERKLDFGHSIYVMVESGLLYTLSLVILFAVYITSSNAELGVSDSVVQIIGITFNMIIIRTSHVSSRTQSTAPGPTTIHSEASQPPPPHMISIHTVTDTDCCPDTPLSPLPNRSIRSQYRSSRSSRRSRYSSCPPSEVVPSPSMIGHPGFATLQKQSLLEIPGPEKFAPSRYERSERSVRYVDSHRSLREDTTTVIEGTAESYDNTVLFGAV